MERNRGGDSIQGKSFRVNVGCAGWSSFRPAVFFGKDWKKRFSSMLNAYSHVFTFVEVNSTFYRLPKIETAERWRKEAGKGLIFSLKAPKTITHERFFNNVEDVTERTIEVANALKAFFILFQTPKSFRFTDERFRTLTDYILSLPDSFTYGVELRGWKKEEVQKLVEKTGVIDVVDPFVREPVDINSIDYIRLHGKPPGIRMYVYRYTEDDLIWLYRFIEGRRRDTFVVFNNVWMCDNALQFSEIVNNILQQ